MARTLQKKEQIDYSHVILKIKVGYNTIQKRIKKGKKKEKKILSSKEFLTPFRYVYMHEKKKVKRLINNFNLEFPNANIYIFVFKVFKKKKPATTRVTD